MGFFYYPTVVPFGVDRHLDILLIFRRNGGIKAVVVEIVVGDASRYLHVPSAVTPEGKERKT